MWYLTMLYISLATGGREITLPVEYATKADCQRAKAILAKKVTPEMKADIQCFNQEGVDHITTISQITGQPFSTEFQ